uniref:Uncharacterized protein n=1 Tax=Setaria viridis TaxID=4556 RepID=A0A4V6D1C1_SETVI|nr:hypothetical protein SEVIR_9G271500v2 [Setaria viridis]
MQKVKYSGHLPQGFKGISIRDSEGGEFRMDLTQTQHSDVNPDAVSNAAEREGTSAAGGVQNPARAPTFDFSSNNEPPLDDPPPDGESSQSSSQTASGCSAEGPCQ